MWFYVPIFCLCTTTEESVGRGAFLLSGKYRPVRRHGGRTLLELFALFRILLRDSQSEAGLGIQTLSKSIHDTPSATRLADADPLAGLSYRRNSPGNHAQHASLAALLCSKRRTTLHETFG